MKRRHDATTRQAILELCVCVRVFMLIEWWVVRVIGSWSIDLSYITRYSIDIFIYNDLNKALYNNTKTTLQSIEISEISKFLSSLFS